jgi:hypothetical protein
MTIQDNIHSTLSGVGTTYPLAVPNSGASYPCIVYQFISEVQMRSHSGNGLRKHRVQISCWATTYAAAVTLAESVKAALDLNQTNYELATHETSRDEKEVETGLSRRMMDFFVWL